MGNIRHAFRIAAKQPGFTLLIVLTMALGIGAATAAFSIVDTVFLRTLPYKNARRLMSVFMTVPSMRSNPALSKVWDQLGPSLEQFNELKNHQTSFDELSILRNMKASLETGGRRRIRLGSVSANFFPMLGIQARRGRLFSVDDDKPQAVHTAILSQDLWRNAFGGDDAAMGKTITIRTWRGVEQYVVIGVLPRDFEFADYRPDPNRTPDIWVPAAISNQPGDDYEVIATLKPGVSVSDAERETQSIFDGSLSNDMRHLFGNVGARLSFRQTEQASDIRTSLYVLVASSGLLLLIACGNVANLLVAQGSARSHEMAVRAAIGAGRRHILRQLITQGLTLSLFGGLAGTLIAYWTIHALIGLSPVAVPRAAEIGIDLRVLLFALAASTLTGVLFGLAPALPAMRPNLNEVLKAAGRTRATPHNRVQELIIVAEISLSFALLVGAGLLTQTLFRMWSESNRTQVEHVLTVQADFFAARFQTPSEAVTFTNVALERLRSLPGVESVTGASPAPFGGRGLDGVEIEGMPIPKGTSPPLIDNRYVLKDYFSTVRLPILAGRALMADDVSREAHVAVVNKTFAQRFWSVETAVNKRFRGVGPQGESQAPWVTIVGVCDDTRDLSGSEREILPVLYAPFASNADITFIIRTTGDPSALASTVRQEFATLNNNVVIGQTETMDNLLWKDLANERYRAVLINIFALTAVVLALIGLYGVISRFVANRTRELSIRMALGAKPQDVLAFVLRQSLLLTTAGVAIGIAGALATTRLLAALLFGVSATDPSTYVGVAAAFFVVAALATYLPARRAARSDPIMALRAE
jgi:predicted permease